MFHSTPIEQNQCLPIRHVGLQALAEVMERFPLTFSAELLEDCAYNGSVPSFYYCHSLNAGFYIA